MVTGSRDDDTCIILLQQVVSRMLQFRQYPSRDAIATGLLDRASARARGTRQGWVVLELSCSRLSPADRAVSSQVSAGPRCRVQHAW